MQPLASLMGFSGAAGETEPVVFVVCFDEVFDDGAGFPQGESGVWVVDGGQTTIGVDGFVGGGFEFAPVDGHSLRGEVEFGEDDGDLEGVGAEGASVDFDGLKHGDYNYLAVVEVGMDVELLYCDGWI